jgi:hypothetical protein
LGWGLKQTCFPTVCRTPFAHTRIGSIPHFLCSGVKLPVSLPALLLTITCTVDVQMAHVRSFSTSTLQTLSNGMKSTSRPGVLTSAIELWSCGSPKGLRIPTFGSVSLILTLASKWSCDKLPLIMCCRVLFLKFLSIWFYLQI